MRDLWIRQALLGVPSQTEFAIEGPLGTLLGEVVTQQDAALGFSRGIGILAACARAAVVIDPAPSALPAPAPEDRQRLPETHAWSAVLREVFAGSTSTHHHDLRLRHEACLRLQHAGKTLPASVLPDALSTGRRSNELRAALMPVLGSLGRWLAERNPEWKFACGHAQGDSGSDETDAAVWQDGNHADRLLWLERLRQRDPAAARLRFVEGMANMSAKERAEFVPLFADQLSADDTEFLTGLMRDRSREVRGLAARLLALLPESEHAKQLISWLQPLVVGKRGLLGTGWRCEAPEAADPLWAAAGVEPKRPQYERLGERAWWLYQLIRQVRLNWWCDHTGMNPSKLVAWALKSDWREALLRGWIDRVGAEDQPWIEALLEIDLGELRGRTGELLSLLPPRVRERYWPNDVRALHAKRMTGDVIASVGLGEHLSAEFSKPLLASLVTCFEDDSIRHDYELRGALIALAALLHPSCLPKATALRRPAEETPAMSECASTFERVLHVRQQLLLIA